MLESIYKLYSSSQPPNSSPSLLVSARGSAGIAAALSAITRRTSASTSLAIASFVRRNSIAGRLPWANRRSPRLYHEPFRSTTPNWSAASRRQPSLSTPEPNNISNSTWRKGGATCNREIRHSYNLPYESKINNTLQLTLFFTILTFTVIPWLSLSTSLLRISTLTEE